MDRISLLDQILPRAGSRLVIAGGCGGIGRALTERALGLGLDVVVMDLPAAVEQHRRDDVEMLSGNLSDPDEVATLFRTLERTGRPIDGFVTLMGFTNVPGPLDEMDIARWDEVMTGNLRSVQLTCRAALPLLRASGAGSIVTVSSGQGVRPIAGFGPYGVAKAGVIALTRALALENAPDIRVNAVAPGAVRTAFLTGGTGRPQRAGEAIDDKAERYAANIPMGRIADPFDVVDPILFLLGPGARFITGQVLHVNGGGLMA